MAVIGAYLSAGGLVVMGMAAWKVFRPCPKQNTAAVDAAALIRPNPPPEGQQKQLTPIEFLQLRNSSNLLPHRQRIKRRAKFSHPPSGAT